MKTLTLRRAIIAFLGLAVASMSAQTQSTTSTNTTYIQTSKLVGTKVKSSQREEIGTIRDVVLDRNTGCMAYTVLSSGGGGARARGGKMVAVPWAVYSPTSNVSELVVTVDRDRIYNAPVFDYARIDEYSRPDYITNVYSYYGVSQGDRGWCWSFNGHNYDNGATTATGAATGAGTQTGAAVSPGGNAPPAATAPPARMPHQLRVEHRQQPSVQLHQRERAPQRLQALAAEKPPVRQTKEVEVRQVRPRRLLRRVGVAKPNRVLRRSDLDPRERARPKGNLAHANRGLKVHNPDPKKRRQVKGPPGHVIAREPENTKRLVHPRNLKNHHHNNQSRLVTIFRS